MWLKVCDVIKIVSAYTTSKLFHLNTQVLAKQPEYYYKPQLSVQIIRSSLVAAFHCGPNWMLVHGSCLRLLRIVDGKRLIEKLQHTCQSLDSSSHVAVASPGIYENALFQRSLRLWDLQIQDIAFMNMNQSMCRKIDKWNRETPCGERNVPSYVACTREAFAAECPYGYITCAEGCIPDVFWCADDDRKICTTSFMARAEFCFRHCHPDNCTCNNLYFQCPSGGCIHTVRVCDRKSDCLYGEDEALCPDHYAVGFEEKWKSRPSKEDDFFPDEEHAADEKQYSTLLKTYAVTRNTFCSVGLELPCMKGHSTCYPVGKQCVYDHEEDGSLKYCRNGAHLEQCTSLSSNECSGTFKCKHSYCIPSHKVCDGIIDCPNRDDESQCPLQRCHKMLHCGGVCIYPSEICDGIPQCPDGDDELVCEAPVCPKGCQCLGYSMFCTTVSVNNITANKLLHTKMLIIRQNLSDIELRTVIVADYLLILDVSNCFIRRIGTGEHRGFNNLVKYNISHNIITALSDGSFSGLTNLVYLDISWNLLDYVEKGAFTGLYKLHSLLLHHCRLLHLSLILFLPLERMYTLDVSFNLISKLDYTCFEDSRMLAVHMNGNQVKKVNPGQSVCSKNTYIVSDQPELCCLKALNGYCGQEVLHASTPACQSLFLPSLLSYVYITEYVIIFLNAMTALYNLSRPKLESVFNSNHCLGNLLIVVPLHFVAKWQSSYGQEVVFYEQFIGGDTMCLLSGLSWVLSSGISGLIMLLIASFKTYAIKKYLLKISPRMTNMFVLCLISSWVISCSISAALAGLNSGSPKQIVHCLLGSSIHESGKYVLFTLIAVNVTTCLITVILYKILLTETRRSQRSQYRAKAWHQ